MAALQIHPSIRWRSCLHRDVPPEHFVIVDVPETAIHHHLDRGLLTLVDLHDCPASIRCATSASLTLPAMLVAWPDSIQLTPTPTSLEERLLFPAIID